MGGVGTYLNQIVPLQIASQGMEVIAVVPADQRSQVVAIPDRNVVAVEGSGRSLAGLARLRGAVREAALRLAPDIVHAHSSFAGLVTRTMGFPSPHRPAIVYCPHGWAFDREGHWAIEQLYALAERQLSRRSDAVVAISKFERRRGMEIGIDPSRIHLVLNGLVDRPSAQRQTADAPDGGLRLLFVGRLDRQKGFDVLLRAMERLGPGVSLRVAGTAVVGTGEASAALPDNVHLLGWLDETAIAEELDRCDVLVVPSRWEGFGLVAIEAMRAGRPVVAARVGGLPEVVVDGETGVLFTPGDADALAAALIRSRHAWRDMGERGRRRFLDRFTAQATADGLLAVYRKCVSAPGFRTAP